MRSQLSVALLAVSLATAAATTTFAAGQGWLGVTTQATDADLRRSLDLTRDGLLVNRVSADSPAARAGLKRGDVILSYNSRSVSEPDELRSLVRDTEPGRNVDLVVWRDGARRTLDVEVGELPGDEEGMFDVPTPGAAPTPEAPETPEPPRAPKAPRSREFSERHEDDGTVHRRMFEDGRELSDKEIEERLKDKDFESLHELKGLKELKDLPGLGWGDSNGRTFMFEGSGRGRLGVRVEKLTGDLAQVLGVTGDGGVLVVEVIEDTPAQKAGVRAGDVIVEVAGHEVSDREDLTKALNDEVGRVDIVLTRKGSRRTVQADLPERKSMSWSRSPGRSFSFRIPEPGRAPRVYRYDTEHNSDGGDAELREEMRQLKEELRELKQQLGDQEQQQLEKAKEPAKPKTPAPAPKKK